MHDIGLTNILNLIGFVIAVLYANLSRIPSLLPSRRSEDQTKQAYKMLSDCFRLMSNIFFSEVSSICYHILTCYIWQILFFFNCFYLIPFRYGMNTSSCRAKTLVEYFGEEFSYEKCQLYVMIIFLRVCGLHSSCLRFIRCCVLLEHNYKELAMNHWNWWIHTLTEWKGG